jgi:hypothetical protein
MLYVANAKGLGAGPNPNGPNPYERDAAPDQFVGSMITGSLSIVPVPDAETLERYTQQVIGNNGFDERDQVRVAGAPDEQVVPRRPGDLRRSSTSSTSSRRTGPTIRSLAPWAKATAIRCSTCSTTLRRRILASWPAAS